MTSLTLRRPDDWHIHLRDGAALELTVPAVARYFGRAIVMPNLMPPVTHLAHADAYRQRILAQIPDGRHFDPLMTLYLTDNTRPEDIEEAAASPFVYACKLYPAGATTNSDSGVTNIANIASVLDAMQACDMPLLVHGEVTDGDIDIFDREKVFIDRILKPLLDARPQLRIVLEHITTKDAVDCVTQGPETLAATITPHHMLYNRNHMLVGGIRPHYYCLPILKRDIHQHALNEAACSGNPKFFLGSDSAPHSVHRKEADCGCAGCYSGHATLELYTEAFEANDALDQLEAFASINGPKFYQLPVSEELITLEKNDWMVPESYDMAGAPVKPLGAGESLRWQVLETPSSQVRS